MSEPKDSSEDRSYKVYKLDKGTVIDHIPHWKAREVIDILELRGNPNLVTLGIGLDSKAMGKKDLLKIENKKLTQEELNKIALVAKHATINIIEGSKVKEKFMVKLPDEIRCLVRCENRGCITRHEDVPTIFYKASEDPIMIQCHYCESMIKEGDIELL